MIKTISERLVIEMFVLNDVSWPYTSEKRKVSFLQMLKYMISMTIKLCVFLKLKFPLTHLLFTIQTVILQCFVTGFMTSISKHNCNNVTFRLNYCRQL